MREDRQSAEPQPISGSGIRSSSVWLGYRPVGVLTEPGDHSQACADATALVHTVAWGVIQ
jgi:hypothetical protein